MKTSDMIKELCNKKNISVSELARRIGQTPQNFGKKLKRDTVTLEELNQSAQNPITYLYPLEKDKIHIQ